MNKRKEAALRLLYAAIGIAIFIACLIGMCELLRLIEGVVPW